MHFVELSNNSNINNEFFNQPITNLKSIGPRREFLLKRTGVKTFGHLLLLLPKKFLKQTNELHQGDVVLNLTIKSKYKTGPRWTVESVFSDGNVIKMIFFSQKQLNMFLCHNEYRVYGKLINKGTQQYPEWILNNAKILNKAFDSIIPVYETSVSSVIIYKLVHQIIEQLDETPILPGKMSLKKILYNLHNNIDYEEAYNNLKMLEAVLFVTLFEDKIKYDELNLDSELLKQVKLPFELNNQQKNVIETIISELSSNKPMRHMLFAEVGAGKTIISFLCSLLMIKAGYKVVFLVPTVTLLNQHIQSFENFFGNLNIKVQVVGRGYKEEVSDVAQMIFATHALLYRDNIENVGLVIIDEMQRFGVFQRAQLLANAKRKNLLMLTATPIPRSLNILLKEYIKFSVIKQAAFKKQITTQILSDGKIDALIERIKISCKKTYWVLPSIDETDYSIGAVNRFEYIKAFFENCEEIVLIHGKMKLAEQKEAIERFKQAGKILIATTIVEIGIDIPDADIMIIECANRFGLAQLHQLRGRVGRRGQEAYCILLYSKKYPKKLDILKENDHGFGVSEQDLKLRGAGKILGTLQHGHFNRFTFLDQEDTDILEQAKKFVSENQITNWPTFSLLLDVSELIH